MHLIPRATLALALCLPAPLLAHGDVHDQIAEITRLLAKDKGNVDLYLRRAELHRLHEDWSAALADLDAAGRLDPELTVVDAARGRTLLQAGRPAEALAALDRVTGHRGSGREYRGDEGEAQILRGRALTALGRHQEAAQAYSRGLAVHPRPVPEHYLERAAAERAAGRPEAAVTGLLEGIARLGPVAPLELALLDLEVAAGRLDAALARLERLAAASERKETWLVRRAELLERVGRKDEAREAWGRALAALEGLPRRVRGTPATAELERRVRAALSAGDKG